MKVTKEDACVILPRHELADSYPRLQSALPRRRVELMKTRSPRVEPQTYHVTVSISLDDARSTCPSAPAWVAAVRHKGFFAGASSPSRASAEANEEKDLVFLTFGKLEIVTFRFKEEMNARYE